MDAAAEHHSKQERGEARNEGQEQPDDSQGDKHQAKNRQKQALVERAALSHGSKYITVDWPHNPIANTVGTPGQPNCRQTNASPC